MGWGEEGGGGWGVWRSSIPRNNIRLALYGVDVKTVP